MSERYDVVHLVAPGAVGGIESVIRLLAAGQVRRGQRVCVAPTLDAPDAAAPFIDALEDEGVAVVRIAAGRHYMLEWRQISHICRRAQPRVVHTHGYRADVIGASAARRAGVPTVTTVHGFTGGDWKNRWYERVQRYVFRHFDAVVPVSAPMAELLGASRVAPERMHLVPNAYAGRPALPRAEARRALGIPGGEKEFRVGWIGRITHEKGLDLAVRAIAHPSATGSVLSVIGDGRERDTVARLARTLGVSDRVTFHGLVPEAGTLVRAFDALLLSSRTEGTPIVLFEAMAAETPIIATRVGGVPDVVRPTEAALVPPEDPGAIAGVVQALRLDGTAAAARAAAAQARLRAEFAVEPWLDRYERVYASAIARRQAAA